MLGGRYWVTRSPHRAVQWVSSPVASWQESSHLTGAATRQGGVVGRCHFVGVSFPFITSGLLHTLPCRTCLPGDNLDASASLTGNRQSPALAKTLQPPSNPPFYFEEDGQKPQRWSGCWWGSVPRGPHVLGAGRSMLPLRGPSWGMQTWLAPRLRHGCRSFQFTPLPQGEQEESLPPPRLRKMRR